MSREIEEVPSLPVNSFMCHACLMYKFKRVPVLSSTRKADFHLEHVHVYILGPIKTASLHGALYVIGIIYDYTAKYDVFFLTKRSETFHHLRAYEVLE